MLERYADPRALLAAGPAQLTALISAASRGHQGQARAAQWAAAAQAATELYGPDDPAVPYADLAAEVATEIRLLQAIETELTAHAAAREAGEGDLLRGRETRPDDAGARAEDVMIAVGDGDRHVQRPAGGHGATVGCQQRFVGGAFGGRADVGEADGEVGGEPHDHVFVVPEPAGCG